MPRQSATTIAEDATIRANGQTNNSNTH